MTDQKAMLQKVEIEKNNNTRHLGGYKTDDGKVVRWDKLIRSALPTDFTDQDIQTLKKEYKLNLIVDLRSDAEAEKKPSLTDIPDIKYINLPMLPPDESVANEHIKKPAYDGNMWLDLYNHIGGTPEAMLNDFGRIYTEMFSSEYSRKITRQIFDLLLENEDGATLYHCAGGKDRTGILSLLILTALGVDFETCVEDYLLTDIFSAENINREMDILREATDDQEVLDAIRPIFGADVRVLKIAIDYVNECFGSIMNYLKDIIGLTDEKIKRLKALYTVSID